MPTKNITPPDPQAAPKPKRRTRVADETELLHFFTDMLRDEDTPAQHRMKAAELLAKLRGLPAETPPDTTITIVAQAPVKGWME